MASLSSVTLTSKNRLLIIDKGKKLVEGNAEELFDPTYSVIELDTLNNEQSLALIKQSEWGNLVQPSRSGTIKLKMEREKIPAFHQALAAMQVPVISLQPRHSLEDYFLQVTTGKQHVEAFKD
jgi:ABC-type multidrug transport system ATPase subunit